MLRENAAVAEQLCGCVSGSDVECGLDWSVFDFLGGGVGLFYLASTHRFIIIFFL